MFAKSPINFHNLPPKEQNKRTEQTMVRDACVCVCLCVSVSLCPSMCLCVHECFGFTFLFFFQNQDDWLLRCSDFGFVEIKTARIGCLLKSACCQKWCVCAHVEASNTTVGELENKFAAVSSRLVFFMCSCTFPLLLGNAAMQSSVKMKLLSNNIAKDIIGTPLNVSEAVLLTPPG